MSDPNPGDRYRCMQNRVGAHKPICNVIVNHVQSLVHSLDQGRLQPGDEIIVECFEVKAFNIISVGVVSLPSIRYHTHDFYNWIPLEDCELVLPFFQSEVAPQECKCPSL